MHKPITLRLPEVVKKEARNLLPPKLGALPLSMLLPVPLLWGKLLDLQFQTPIGSSFTHTPRGNLCNSITGLG